MKRLIIKIICLATAALFLVCFGMSALRAIDDSEILKAIEHGQQSYIESVKKLSVQMALFVSLNGEDMVQSTQEFIQDDKNYFVKHILIFDKYTIESDRPDLRSSSGISRIRGLYRQELGLSRATLTVPWIITSDITSPLTEENRSLHFENNSILGREHFDSFRIAPHYYNLTISELIRLSGFRLNSVADERIGSERLVTIDFTIDPPINQKAPKTFIRSGNMKLRPTACWTLKSGTFQLDASSRAGKLIECVVTNTYHVEPEKTKLPKEIKCESTIITKDNKKAKEVSRSTYQFTSHVALPDERFSLSQFGMSEREPVINTHAETPVDSNPNVSADKRNYIVASNLIPSYLWLTAIGILLLIFGIALRIWLVRTSRFNALVTKSSSGK